MVKRTVMEKRLRFFFTMFSTSDVTPNGNPRWLGKILGFTNEPLEFEKQAVEVQNSVIVEQTSNQMSSRMCAQSPLCAYITTDSCKLCETNSSYIWWHCETKIVCHVTKGHIQAPFSRNPSIYSSMALIGKRFTIPWVSRDYNIIAN